MNKRSLTAALAAGAGTVAAGLAMAVPAHAATTSHVHAATRPAAKADVDPAAQCAQVLYEAPQGYDSVCAWRGPDYQGSIGLAPSPVRPGDCVTLTEPVQSVYNAGWAGVYMYSGPDCTGDAGYVQPNNGSGSLPYAVQSWR